MKQRDEFIDNNEFENIIASLGKSKYQRSLWEKYKAVTPFARELAFEDVINKLMVVSRDIISAKNINRHDTKLNKDK